MNWLDKRVDKVALFSKMHRLAVIGSRTLALLMPLVKPLHL